MTNCPNRSKILSEFEAAICRYAKDQKPFSVAMIDLDCFKEINDRFGHTEGEKVLAEIASIMRDNLPESIFFGRYGGDEFLLLLPNTTREIAKEIIEDLKKKVVKSPTLKPYQISYSFGVVEMNSTFVRALNLIDAADQIMYQNKNKDKR